MTSKFSDPPISPDIDVKGMPGFILRVDRLLASELNAIGTADEKWVALILYCRAFQQTPAGSLPDDDRVLAKLSGDPRNWKKLKPVALRGWVKCTDGRLYHRVLSDYVIIASNARLKQNSGPNVAKTERQARWRANLSEMSERLRAMGVTPPPGASLKTMRRLLVDAERASTKTSYGTGTVDEYASRETDCNYKSTSTRLTSQDDIGSSRVSISRAHAREEARPRLGWERGGCR